MRAAPLGALALAALALSGCLAWSAEPTGSASVDWRADVEIQHTQIGARGESRNACVVIQGAEPFTLRNLRSEATWNPTHPAASELQFRTRDLASYVVDGSPLRFHADELDSEPAAEHRHQIHLILQPVKDAAGHYWFEQPVSWTLRGEATVPVEVRSTVCGSSH